MSSWVTTRCLVKAAWIALVGTEIVFSTQAMAQVTGQMYMTRFADTPNIGRFDYSYNGKTLTLSNVNWFATTLGADGIIANPQQPNHLLVGAQQYNAIHDVDTEYGITIAYSAPTEIYHLVAVDEKTILGNSIPGSIARFTVSPNGALSSGKVVSLVGDDLWVTQVIPTPVGYFYTADSAGNGHGAFGRLVFSADSLSATTTRLMHNLTSAHGATYDPFSHTILTFGDEHITQIDLDGDIVSDLAVPSPEWYPMHFDQGSVDGQGRVFVASNTGHLAFVDYAASGKVGDPSNFVDVKFIAFFLDDVAPLIGFGGTATALESNKKCNNGFGNGADCEPPGHVDNSSARHQMQDELATKGAVAAKARKK